MTENEIIDRILEINQKFHRNKCDYENETLTKTSTVSSPSVTLNHNVNSTNDCHQRDQILQENRKYRLEQEGLFGFYSFENCKHLYS